jgi:tyrosine-protein kinase
MEVAGVTPPSRTNSTRNFLATYAWLILAITAEVVLVALLLPGLQPPKYESSAYVIVEPGIYPNGAPVEANMGTERVIATSGVIAHNVASQLNVPLKQVDRGLSVSVPVDTSSLVISYTSTDKNIVKQRAQAFATAYVSYRRLLDARLRHASDTIRAGTSKPPVTADIVTPAQPPVATGPRKLLYAGFGLFMGALLGLGTAIAWDKLRDRARSAGDVEAETALPVLATLPRLPARRQTPGASNVVLHDPRSRAAEGYRYLRARVLHAADERGQMIVMLAGCRPGTITVATAVNLAAFCAASGQRTILVDADVHQPTVHQWFGFEQPPGLSEALWGHHPAQTVLYQTEIAGLRILPAGNTHEGLGGGEVLQTSALTRVLASLHDSADLVIVIAPAVLASADSAVVAEAAEMVLLVADARRDSREQLREAVGSLVHVRERILGWVFAEVGSAGVGPAPSPRKKTTSKGQPTARDDREPMTGVSD